MILARAGLACALLVSLSGCATTTPEVTAPAAAAAAAVVVPPPPYSGLASGSLGGSLDAVSRTAANDAEVAALNSGERKTWRGADGAYGYVAPGAATGDCRELSHTIYINGRPQIGKGTACRAAGGWKLNS
jgi:surface antigen